MHSDITEEVEDEDRQEEQDEQDEQEEQEEQEDLVIDVVDGEEGDMVYLELNEEAIGQTRPVSLSRKERLGGAKSSLFTFEVS